MTTKHFIVTGTNRSATGFRAELLTLAGFPTGHEAVFGTKGFEGWGPFVGASSWMAVPFLDDFPRERKVLVTRHPLPTIRSMLRQGSFHKSNKWIAFAKRHMPEVWADFDTPFERACHLWSRWNRWALAHVDSVLQQEDINEDIGLLFDDLGIKGDMETAMFLGKDVNARPPAVEWPEIKWEDLPHEVYLTGKEFGYDHP